MTTGRHSLSYRLQTWLGRTKLIVWLRELDPKSFRYLPQLPSFVKRWRSTTPAFGPRSLEVPPVPEQLLTVPGIARDSVAAEAAFETVPLYRFSDLYPEIRKLNKTDSKWISTLPMAPLRGRVQQRLDAAALEYKPPSTAVANGTPPSESLTIALRQRAAEIGMSAIGIAEYDPKYIFQPYLEKDLGDRVVVCLLEMNWAATQTAPSSRHERAAHHAMWQLGDLCRQLAEFLREKGYGVEGAILAEGRGISIHYAVEAGLGQLGLNGQLLTPFAGSRCRLMLLHTDAPLVFDRPRDYGINKICDACKACVRRCPSGAIPSERKMSRGVLKAKIKTERCYPMVMQADGCAVCLKVCPVQRYGLPAVLDEFQKSGQILGKNTDELEGYDWPVDGRHYGPGEKPRSAVTAASLHPQGYIHDVNRVKPVDVSGSGKLAKEKVLDM